MNMYKMLFWKKFDLTVNQDIGVLGVKINVQKKIAKVVIVILPLGFVPNVSLGFGDSTAVVDALLTNVWNATKMMASVRCARPDFGGKNATYFVQASAAAVTLFLVNVFRTNARP
jgi:hypothetical protein